MVAIHYDTPHISATRARPVEALGRSVGCSSTSPPRGPIRCWRSWTNSVGSQGTRLSVRECRGPARRECPGGGAGRRGTPACVWIAWRGHDSRLSPSTLPRTSARPRLDALRTVAAIAGPARSRDSSSPAWRTLFMRLMAATSGSGAQGKLPRPKRSSATSRSTARLGFVIFVGIFSRRRRASLYIGFRHFLPNPIALARRHLRRPSPRHVRGRRPDVVRQRRLRDPRAAGARGRRSHVAGAAVRRDVQRPGDALRCRV